VNIPMRTPPDIDFVVHIVEMAGRNRCVGHRAVPLPKAVASACATARDKRNFLTGKADWSCRGADSRLW